MVQFIVFHKVVKRILFIALTTFVCLQANAQMVAVKTDLLKDVAMMPNAGVELVVGERHTMGLQFFGAKNPWGNEVGIIGITPSFRYWLSGRTMSRLFVGVNAQVVNYDVKWGKDIFQGNAAALGLSLGYAFNLSKHLNLEIEGGTQIMSYSQKEYCKGDSYTQYGEKSSAHGTILFPRLEFSFVYVIR